MKTATREMATAKPGTMMRPHATRRIIIGTAIILIGGIGWYLFRPELLFVNRSVNEALPTGSAIADKTLASGMFHNGAHQTTGTATVHQLADGTRVLRLTGFETSNGPDVHVYLVAASDATDSDTVKTAGFVDLGSLKGNVGDQNYEVPDDVSLDKYRAVTIWCARFGVNFGTAALTK